MKITIFCGNCVSNYILFLLYRKGIVDKFEIKYQTVDEIKARVKDSYFLRSGLSNTQLKIFESIQQDENVIDEFFERIGVDVFYKFDALTLKDFQKLFAPNRIPQLVFFVDNNLLIIENKSSK